MYSYKVRIEWLEYAGPGNAVEVYEGTSTEANERAIIESNIELCADDLVVDEVIETPEGFNVVIWWGEYHDTFVTEGYDREEAIEVALEDAIRSFDVTVLEIEPINPFED